jgi:hypothetical protein
MMNVMRTFKNNNVKQVLKRCYSLEDKDFIKKNILHYFNKYMNQSIIPNKVNLNKQLNKKNVYTDAAKVVIIEDYQKKYDIAEKAYLKNLKELFGNNFNQTSEEYKYLKLIETSLLLELDIANFKNNDEFSDIIINRKKPDYYFYTYF